MSYIDRGTPLDSFADIHFSNTTPLGQAVLLNTPTTIDITTYTQDRSYVNDFIDNGDGTLTYDGVSGVYHLIMQNYLFFTHSTGTSAVIGLSISINGAEITNSRGVFLIGNLLVGHNMNHEYIQLLNNGDVISFNIVDQSRAETLTFQKFSATIKSLIQL